MAYNPTPSPRKARHKRSKPPKPTAPLTIPSSSETSPPQTILVATSPSLPPGYNQTLHASPATVWSTRHPQEVLLDHDENALFSDRPPDYPDSAEEADEETELDSSSEGGDRDSPPPLPPPARRPPTRLQLQSFHLSPLQQQHHYTSTTRHQHSYSNPPPHTASPRRQKRFLHQQQQSFSPSTGGFGRGRSEIEAGSSSNSTPSSAKSHKRRHSSTAVLRSRGSGDSADVDSYLDSLLERSVHALELSNTLLESSISTRATMSAVLTSPEYHSGHVESALEARAIGLSSNLLRNWDVQDNWAEQLDSIKQGVESLFSEEPEEVGNESILGDSLSRSVSHSSSNSLRNGHDQRVNSPQLRLAPQDRAALVSPAPRALTMYVDANSSVSSPSLARFQTPELDPLSPTSFMLPPTLGTRPSMPTIHSTPSVATGNKLYSSANASTASSSMSHLPMAPSSASAVGISSALEPQLTERQTEPTTPAYNMLSNLAARSSALNLNHHASSSSLATTSALQVSSSSPSTSGSGTLMVKKPITVSASAPSSFVSSFLSSVVSLGRRNSSPPPLPTTPSRGIGRSRSANPSASTSATASPHQSRPSRPTPSPNNTLSRHESSPHRNGRRRSVSADRSSASFTARSSPVIQVRQMTPPTEGTDEEASSSSSSEGPVAKQTLVSLRKILDELPPPAQALPQADDLQEAGYGEEERQEEEQRGRVQQWRRPPSALMAPRIVVAPPSIGTSTATASISRLFTKGVHTSSTRHRSPPLKSVMKRRGVASENGSAASPSPSPSVASFGGTANGVETPPQAPAPAEGQDGGSAESTALSASTSSITGTTSLAASSGIPGNLGALVTRALLKSKTTPSNTPPSSGVSTPKRISFAAFPESYASTKPESEQGSVGRKRRAASASRKNRKAGRKAASEDSEPESAGGWWSAWLGAPDGYGPGSRDRERVEERATRRLGMSMGMGMHGGGHLGVLDEWGV